MHRIMWAPLGTDGEVLHAIAVIHKGRDTLLPCAATTSRCLPRSQA